jgi:hypothetical protein
MPEPDETLDAPAYEPPTQRRSAFRQALIRNVILLMVLAVVVAGAVMWIVGRSFDRGPHPGHQAAWLIQTVRMACEAFRLENGFYPWPKAGETGAAAEIDGRAVYVELRALPGAKVNTTQDFLGEVPKRSLKHSRLVDPWGHELMIRVDPKTGQPVIWSCGPNGLDDTNDGDSPDPAKFPKGYYWFGKGGTGDDITTL